VFSTKGRVPILIPERRKDIFAYMWGVIKKKQCHLYRINSMADHVHIFCSLHPSVPLAILVRDIKVATTSLIKRENLLPGFPGWQDKYAAFTKSHGHREHVINYIKEQEEHHTAGLTFLDELKILLSEEGIEYDERYLA
jgi:REP element-mobilizing transposase RayT